MAKHLETVPGALPTEFYSDWDGNKEKLIINRTQDCTPILEENRRKRNEFNGRYGDIQEVAQIPKNRGAVLSAIDNELFLASVPIGVELRWQCAWHCL